MARAGTGTCLGLGVHVCVGLYLGSHSVPLVSVYPCPQSRLSLLLITSFIITLNIQKKKLSHLVHYFRAIFGLLNFHINLRIDMLSLTRKEKKFRIFIAITLKPYTNLGAIIS